MARYFSSQPIYNAPVDSIDHLNGIIRGVTIAQVGPARGHEAFLDKTFLLQIVDQANSRPQGIKARFGHPNMCSTALGTYLGRFTNYSYQSDKVKADLQLDATAKTSPKGNLYDYVLDMADKNPDMFGASIVFEPNDLESVEEADQGKKLKRNCFRLKELRATDIVDDPAATDGLFSADTLPGLATQLLDENPQLTDLIFSRPESLVEFLTNYLNNNTMNFNEKVVENFRKIFSSKAKLETSEITSNEDTAAAFCNKFSELIPGIFNDEGGNPKELSTDDKLNLIFETWSGNLQELADARDQIKELNEKLSVRPSIPLNVTDPLVTVNHNTEDPDDTGKQILASLPHDLKRKLKSK